MYQYTIGRKENILFETDRLVLQRFRKEDLRDLSDMAKTANPNATVPEIKRLRELNR